MDTAAPWVSVIIPAWNAAGILPDCLRALQQQEGGLDYELIVVDDGSSDETAAVAAGLGARVIRQANAGPAAARNAGARQAHGAVLAFTDADCAPAGDWLLRLTAPLGDPQVVGVKGTYRTRQGERVARLVQAEYADKYRRMARRTTIDFIDTYSAAYRRGVFLENGGFDERFPVPSVEDQEFSFRLARKGYRLVFAPQAIVYHRHDRTWGEYLRRKWGIGYWKAFMLRWLPEKTFTDAHTAPEQRMQIVLLAGLLAAILAAALVPAAAGVFALLALACALLFVLSALPFMRFLWAEDAGLVWLALPLHVCRALALGAGLAAGLLLPPRCAPAGGGGLSLGQRLAKRMLDVVGAVLGLVLSAPLLLLAALAIRRDGPGPVFFVQERAGEHGRPFRMFKLRTMVPDAGQKLDEILARNPLNGPVYKLPDDPRVTRAGRWLRRWSLDELPQFYNVLRGEMSLVGPRPEETWVVARYDDRQRQRLAVKPGMTGPMQVNGRGDLHLEERLVLELDYIRHYSLRKDVEILWKTLAVVFSGQGAY